MAKSRRARKRRFYPRPDGARLTLEQAVKWLDMQIESRDRMIAICTALLVSGEYTIYTSRTPDLIRDNIAYYRAERKKFVFEKSQLTKGVPRR